MLLSNKAWQILKLLKQIGEGIANSSGSDARTFPLASSLIAGILLVLVAHTGAKGDLKTLTMLIDNIKEDLVGLFEAPALLSKVRTLCLHVG